MVSSTILVGVGTLSLLPCSLSVSSCAAAQSSSNQRLSHLYTLCHPHQSLPAVEPSMPSALSLEKKLTTNPLQPRLQHYPCIH